MMYEIRRRKPKSTLLLTQRIFNLPHLTSTVWEELAFDNALSYTQWEKWIAAQLNAMTVTWIRMYERWVTYMSLTPLTLSELWATPLCTQPDGMAEWVERLPPILGDRGIRPSWIRTVVELNQWLTNWYLSFPSQALGNMRIGKGPIGSVSVRIIWLSGISGTHDIRYTQLDPVYMYSRLCLRVCWTVCVHVW